MWETFAVLVYLSGMFFTWRMIRHAKSHGFCRGPGDMECVVFWWFFWAAVAYAWLKAHRVHS